MFDLKAFQINALQAVRRRMKQQVKGFDHNGAPINVFTFTDARQIINRIAKASIDVCEADARDILKLFPSSPELTPYMVGLSEKSSMSDIIDAAAEYLLVNSVHTPELQAEFREEWDSYSLDDLDETISTSNAIICAWEGVKFKGLVPINFDRHSTSLDASELKEAKISCFKHEYYLRSNIDPNNYSLHRRLHEAFDFFQDCQMGIINQEDFSLTPMRMT